MSNLLDEALIDAEALRETALKNAEAVLLEKFSDQIKGAVETILEQDDLEDSEEDVDVTPELPLANAGGVEMCPCPDNEEIIQVTVDLDALEDEVGDTDVDELDFEKVTDEIGDELELEEELLQSLAETVQDTVDLDEITLKQLAEVVEELDEAPEELEEEDTTLMGSEQNVAAAEDAEAKERAAANPADAPYAATNESQETSEATEDVVEEALTVDIKPVKSGWAGTPEEMIVYAEEELLAMLQDSEKREHHEAIVKAVKALQEVCEKLESRLGRALKDKEEVLSLSIQMKDKLQESNLANSKLLYTNKVLMSDSLNERQKSKIVEALSNAVSVEEAKVIFETLQSATGSTVKDKKPESLSEAVGNTTSTMIISHRKKQNEGEESLNESSLDRWKALAGLNKTTR
tara:strand:- start:172 stop:1389 length:1218 start_codon:yes stop_codon:yes gene_type:complete